MGYEPFSKKWKFRMWIANLISELDKNVCWSSICSWATGLSDEISIWPWHPEYPNYQYCTEKTGAYCGKCIQTGRLVIEEETLCPECNEPRGYDKKDRYVCPCPHCGDDCPF